MPKSIRFCAVLLVVLCACFGVPYFTPTWVTQGFILLLLLSIILLIAVHGYGEEDF